MATITLAADYSKIYKEITSKHFGGNFLFQANSVQEGGPFDYASHNTGVRDLRYPGGSVSESLFDIKNPNDTAGGQVGLAAFMEYAGRHGNSVTIVVPIDNTFYPGSTNPSGRSYNEQHLKNFVNSCIDEAVKNGVVISAFELGNEYWSEHQSNRAQVYGSKASIAAKLIDETLDLRHSAIDDPEILIQMGSSNGGFDISSENAIIINQVASKGAFSSIDGVVHHQYGVGSLDDFKPLVGFGQMEKWRAAATSSGLDGSKLSFNWTEWNVHMGQKSPEDGMRQAGPMIYLFHVGAGGAGVDSMNIWPHYLPNTQNTLSVPDGSGSRLTAAGKTFQMMSESLIGTRSVDLPAASAETPVRQAAFLDDGNKLVVFLYSRSDYIQSVDLELGSLTAGYHHVWAKSLYVTEGSVSDYLAPTEMTAFNGAEIQRDADPNLGFILRPYEVVRVEFTIAKRGVTISGDKQDASADNVMGSAYADKIYGYDGDDSLSGMLGGDTIVGGLGNDVLIGGGGADYLSGGAGNDVYNIDNLNDIIAEGASSGTDIIYSSISLDLNSPDRGFLNIENAVLTGNSDISVGGTVLDNILRGNGGSNLLYGRSGKDLLTGGGGSDTFYFGRNYDQDTVLDFENDIDSIRFYGMGFTSSSQALAYAKQLGGDVIFDFGGGDTLTVRNCVVSALADDLILI